MQSWKTTIAGIATILGALANAYLEYAGGGFVAVNTSALMAALPIGLGLIAAKDFNVSGTKQ